MQIRIYSALPEKEKQELFELVQECNKVDGGYRLPYLDNNYNAVPEMPAFFLAEMDSRTIGYSYAKNSGVEPLPAGVLSLSSFFILLKSSYIPEKGEAIADAIAKVWFGGQGIIGAILIGLAVGSIYTIFIQKHIVIKMPGTS